MAPDLDILGETDTFRQNTRPLLSRTEHRMSAGRVARTHRPGRYSRKRLVWLSLKNPCLRCVVPCRG